MKLPEQVNQLIAEYLEQVRTDPEHQLLPFQRQVLYEALGISEKWNTTSLSLPDKAFGYLCYLTADRVLPIWYAHLDFWNGHEEGFEPINVKRLPVLLLELCGLVLKGELEPQIAREISSEYHAAVGGVADTLFDYEDDRPREIACVCDAANRAISCVVRSKAFGINLIGWEDSTDSELIDGLDVAGYAVLAYAGGEYVGPTDLAKRLEFWEWWLGTAWPLANGEGSIEQYL